LAMSVHLCHLARLHVHCRVFYGQGFIWHSMRAHCCIDW